MVHLGKNGNLEHFFIAVVVAELNMTEIADKETYIQKTARCGDPKWVRRTDNDDDKQSNECEPANQLVHNAWQTHKCFN